MNDKSTSFSSFALLADVKAGDVLIADGGFTCLNDGDHCTVMKDDKDELFVCCAAGKHYLDGQLDDDGRLVGLWPAADEAAVMTATLALHLQRLQKGLFAASVLQTRRIASLSWLLLDDTPDIDGLTLAAKNLLEASTEVRAHAETISLTVAQHLAAQHQEIIGP